MFIILMQALLQKILEGEFDWNSGTGNQPFRKAALTIPRLKSQIKNPFLRTTTY